MTFLTWCHSSTRTCPTPEVDTVASEGSSGGAVSPAMGRACPALLHHSQPQPPQIPQQNIRPQILQLLHRRNPRLHGDGANAVLPRRQNIRRCIANQGNRRAALRPPLPPSLPHG